MTIILKLIFINTTRTNIHFNVCKLSLSLLTSYMFDSGSVIIFNLDAVNLVMILFLKV